MFDLTASDTLLSQHCYVRWSGFRRLLSAISRTPSLLPSDRPPVPLPVFCTCSQTTLPSNSVSAAKSSIMESPSRFLLWKISTACPISMLSLRRHYDCKLTIISLLNMSCFVSNLTFDHSSHPPLITVDRMCVPFLSLSLSSDHPVA
jgi:hypothetical protein